MPKTKKLVAESDIQTSDFATALTPEARENQMIYLATNLAEKQLREGTASSQVIVHYLKLATQKEKLEQEKLALEKELLAARTKEIESQARSEELYEKAISAMKKYTGATYNDEEN